MSRTAKLAWLVAILATVPLCGSSCRRTTEAERLPAGLKIQSALPAFPDDDVFPPNYVLYDVEYPTNLSFQFNEPVSVDEVVVQFFPEPAAPGEKYASRTSGIFRLDGYQPAGQTVIQRILLDGPRFVRPWLQEFLVRQVPAEDMGFIEGQVFHNFSDGPELVNTLMLFYAASEVGEIATRPEIFDHPAASAVLASTDFSWDTELRAGRVVDQLENGAYFTMAAILDTSGDGVYDPRTDWWGVARIPGAIEWQAYFVPATRDGIDLQLLEAEMLPPPVR